MSDLFKERNKLLVHRARLETQISRLNSLILDIYANIPREKERTINKLEMTRKKLTDTDARIKEIDIELKNKGE